MLRVTSGEPIRQLKTTWVSSSIDARVARSMRDATPAAVFSVGAKKSQPNESQPVTPAEESP